MPEAPRQIDPIGSLVVDIIAALTSKLEVPAIEAAAEAAQPVLALPVIKQIFEFLVSEFAGKLAIEEEGLALRLVFKVEADSRLLQLSQAALALQKANQSGDEDAISKATQDAVNQWGNVIHWGGVAPVHT